jgi:hypothetical protein
VISDGCAYEGEIAADRHRAAKRLTCSAIASGQFRLLLPVSTNVVEDISRSGFISEIIIGEGPDNRAIAIHVYRTAEPIAHSTVTREERILKGPERPASDEYVRGSSLGHARRVCERRSNDDSITRQRQGNPETLRDLGRRWQKLLFKCPSRAIEAVDVDGTSVLVHLVVET